MPATRTHRLAVLADPLDALADADLLGRHAAGDGGRAFAALVRRHGPVVFAVCRRALGNATDADDAFQAVFLRLARCGAGVRDPRALPAWLHRVAVRVARRALTRRRPAPPLPPDAADPADPFGGVAWRDLRRVLDEEIDRLPDQLRAPLVLCLLDGLTRDEAAAQLRCSLNTVRRRVDTGRELLRSRLLRRGVGPLAVALGALDPGGLRAVVPPSLGAAAARLGEPGGAVAPVVAALAAAGAPRGGWAVLLVGAVMLAAGGVALTATPGQPRPAADPPPAASTPTPPTEPLPAGAVRRLADDRFRHPGYAAVAAVSADDRRVATLSPDLLQVADLDTGRPLRRIPLKNDGYGYFSTPGLTFSPDGRFVACALNDHLTAVWEADTGREVFRLPERRHGYALCRFTADGKLVLQDADRLRLLALPSGAEVGTRPVGGVADLTRDLSTFVRVEKERERITLGDAVTGQVTHRIAVSTAADGHENGLAFSPDGRRLAVVHDRREVQVWDVAAGTKLTTVPLPAGAVVKADPSYTVGFSADGEVVMFGASAGVAHRWRVGTGAELPALRPHGHRVRLLHPSADGRTVVTADMSGAVTRWDAATGTRAGAAGYTRPVLAAVVPPGDRVVVADHAGRIDLWDVTTGAVARAVSPPGVPVTAIDVSPDGRHLAVGGDGGSVRLIRLADGDATPLHAATPKGSDSRLVRFSPDGALLLAADGGREMRVIDLAARRVLWTSDTIWTAAFAPRGRLIWGRYKVLTVADARTGEPAREKKLDLPGGDGYFASIQAVATSADGRRTACAVPDGEVALFDSVGREVARFPAADRRPDPYRWKYPSPEFHQVRCMAFSPDGRWLVTGAEDRSVRVWDAATGRAVRRFDGHLGSVEQVAITPDGRHAVSAGDDGAVFVWDLRLGATAP